MPDLSWITDEMFEDKLDNIVRRRLLTDWRSIPDIHCDIREFYNNMVIEELEEEKGDD